jgi:hypothetical protein
MRSLIIICILCISLSLFIALGFAETSIKAEVDNTSITTGETLTYKLVITSSDKKLPTPELPKFEGFNVLSQAQSQTISLVKSDVKTILVYAFVLAPTDTGKFKIEPSAIKIKNETYSSDAFEIEVRQGRAKPQAKPEQKPSLPEPTQPESEQPKIVL